MRTQLWLAGRKAVGLLLLSAALAAGPAFGQDQSTPSDQPAVPGWKQSTTKLRFFNATWPDILKKVAEETGSVLVLHEAPGGRLTRNDGQPYTRAEAVRILNSELRDEGFRILEKDQFLIVLHQRTVRTRYRPPVRPDDAPPTEKPGEIVPARRPQHFVQTITPREPKSLDVNGGVRQVSGTSETPPAAPPAQDLVGRVSGPSEPSRAGDPTYKSRGEDRTNVTQPVRTTSSAREVGRALYEGLKSRARLVNNGPNGLPAFEAFDGEIRPGDMPRFAVGVDVVRNELVVQAPADEAASVVRLLQFIDASLQAEGKTQGQTTQVVSPTPTAAAIGAQLSPQLERLAQAAGPNGKIDAGPAAVAFLQAEPPAGQPQPGAPAAGVVGVPPAEAERIRDLIGNLRGNVTIESVPDLGIMILRGNEADVQAVMRIIQEIELRSRGTAPGIELVLLQHVNSEALAELLNSVYTRLTELRDRTGQPRARVSFIPVVRPNSLLVLAPQVEMDSIRKLIEELDKPSDPQAEVQVFRLEHAVASQAATQLTTLFEQQAGAQGAQAVVVGLRPRLRVVADVRTNSLIVQARPNDLAEVARIVRKIDQGYSAAVNKMRIFPLKHAIADELATTINTTINSVLNPSTSLQQAAGGGFAGGGGQQGAPQELRQAKSVVLEFLAVSDEAAKSVRSGLLSDISVTPDLRSNALIVAAPEQTMQMMEELIRSLDKPSPTVAEIKVFTLENADAAVMIPLLETLFASQDGADQLGIQVAGAEDASSGLIPLRFSVDPRTNSILAVGGADALRIVEAILLRLDETDVRQRQNLVYKLKNAPSIDVANAINAFLQSQRDLLTLDPELVSTTELLEREIIVVPEPVSNSLLISATPRYFEEIQRIVLRLDAAPPQVVIQALLVEVTLDNTDEFGIELGFQDDILFTRSQTVADDLVTIAQTITSPNGVQTTSQRIVSQSTTPGFNFNNQPLGRNVAGDFNTTTGQTTLANPTSVGKQGLSSFSLGRVNGDLGFGGLVLSASSSEVSVLLRALAAKRQVHVLSRPQIRTLDNQLAQIQVGQQVPRVNGFTTSGTLGTPLPVIEQVNTGIIMTVTPRINVEGSVVMEVVAEKSEVTDQFVPLITDPTTGQVVESPIIDITTARTTVDVPNGQTVVLGGMITKNDSTLERKVPWLGDIPIIGHAFRYDSTRTRRTELLIFLTPRIVYTDADGELIKQVESERLHFIESEAENLHGPLFSIPGTGLDESFCPLPEDGFPVMPEPSIYDMVPAPAPEALPEEPMVPTTVVPPGALRSPQPEEPQQ